MKGRPIEELIYNQMFPKARPTDPQQFQSILTRMLIPEVRQETQNFYGHLATDEAKYPGLDYCNRTHRIRLSRYPWHRRLFRAFDALQLTPAEIAGLTRWEGTRWAKDKYEQELGIPIRDTAADEIGRFQGVPAPVAPRRDFHLDCEPGDDKNDDDENMSEDDAELDDALHSVGIDLNARLLTGSHDDEFEAWLKTAIESGHLHRDMSEQSFRQLLQSSSFPAGLMPNSMVSAARQGQWEHIPEFLHAILRRTLQSEREAAAEGEAERRAMTFPEYANARAAAHDAEASAASLVRRAMRGDGYDPMPVGAEYHPPARQEWSTRRTIGALRLPATLPQTVLSEGEGFEGNPL